jgi:hypothetical protein
MTITDEEIDRIATKLRDAFHNDLTDCPILNDGAEIILALKARAEAAEAENKRLVKKFGDQIHSLIHQRDEAIVNAKAAEKETDKWDRMWVKAVRTIAERDKEIDALKARVEKAEYRVKRWQDVAEKQASWETLWAEQVERAEAAEKALFAARQAAFIKNIRAEVAEAALKRIANHTSGDVSAMVIARDALESKP